MVFKHDEYFQLLSIKLREHKFFKLFNSDPNDKSKLIHSKSRNKTALFLGFGIIFLGLSIFTIMTFTANSENFESKISDKSNSIITTTNPPQTIQNNERFGNAFSIIPDQIQPGIKEPHLENYDNVQKPPK